MSTKQNRKKDTGSPPTDKEMLDFVIRMATYPYKIYISGPSTGSGREKGSEWLLSYGPLYSQQPAIHCGCVYSSTAEEAIRKAMRVFAAQERAARIVAEASS